MLKQGRLISLCALGLFGWAIDSTQIVAAENNETLCDQAIKNAQILNTYGLLRGAGDCRNAGDPDGASFLHLAGQIRALADIAALEPASDEEAAKIGEVYASIYYQAAGNADEEIYRDIERSRVLFERLDNWNPRLESSYDPGWNYRRFTNDARYSQIIACEKAVRIAKLNWYIGLARDDEYFEASKELERLRAGNRTPVPGSSLSTQMSAIMSRIDRATAAHAPPTTQPFECQFIQTNEPGTDSEFK